MGDSQMGRETSGTDDRLNSSTRRAFVAGLAALGLLPAATSGAVARLDRDRVEVSHGDTGATRANVARGSPVTGHLDLGMFDDEETTISVDGYGLDDEANQVELRMGMGVASVELYCSPSRARELAGELQLAADHADGEY